MRATITAVVKAGRSGAARLVSSVHRRARSVLTTCAELAGGLLVALGVAELNHAAGLIVGGVELILLGVLEAPAAAPPKKATPS